MNDSIDVSVLIVAYRSRDLLRTCLDTLAKAEDQLAVEIVVVDNGDDDTMQMLAREFPQVVATATGENLGFGRAVNRAATMAHGEYLLLLNPDTEVHRGALTALLDEAKANPRAGLYGGQTLAPDGTIDPRSAWGFPTLWSTACWAFGMTATFPRSRAFDPESLGTWGRDTKREVDAIIGCLLLVRADVWRELAGFDERFFMYSEDIDLSRRAWDAGYRPIVVPEAVIMHRIGGSSAQLADRTQLLLTGQVTYFLKHWGRRRARLGVAVLEIGVLIRLAAEVLNPKSRRTSSRWRTVWRGRTGWRVGYPPN